MSLLTQASFDAAHLLALTFVDPVSTSATEVATNASIVAATLDASFCAAQPPSDSTRGKHASRTPGPPANRASDVATHDTSTGSPFRAALT